MVMTWQISQLVRNSKCLFKKIFSIPYVELIHKEIELKFVVCVEVKRIIMKSNDLR